MPLPQLSNRITKIISLTLFAVIGMLKILCIFLINGQTESHCVAGWHVNEELSNHLILVGIGLVPDFIMLLCIGMGMAFERSNIGADPGTIIYNFAVGLLTFCSFFPFFGIEDCKSGSLAQIKLSGILAAIAGVLQITNGVVCLLFLAPEERYEPAAQPSSSNTASGATPRSKPSTSKAANVKVK